MKKICVVFGGESPEHDVSIITGMQCAKFLQAKYKVESIYLGLDNNFYLATGITDPAYFANKSVINLKPVIFYNNSLYKKTIVFKKICQVDCVVNCCHGGAGENGNLAGFFDMLNIPYTSASALSSAIAMDKNLTKQLVSEIVPVVRGVKVDKSNFELMTKKIKEEFAGDLIVKPNALGSSIGVKACTVEDFEQNIKIIFELNDSALVEEKIQPMIELNQACYKKDGSIVLSAIEQPISEQPFLTFDEKYKHESKTKAKDRIIPAKISAKLAKQISDFSLAIYNKLDMNGVVRIDYIFNTNTKTLYFNEINTIPGSLAFYLFEPVGVDYISLIEDLIANASRSKKYSYFDTEILTKKLL